MHFMSIVLIFLKNFFINKTQHLVQANFVLGIFGGHLKNRIKSRKIVVDFT